MWKKLEKNVHQTKLDFFVHLQKKMNCAFPSTKKKERILSINAYLLFYLGFYLVECVHI